MDAIVVFRFGHIHVPLGRRSWTRSLNVQMHAQGHPFNISLLRPQTNNVHEAEGLAESGRIADADIEIHNRCELVDESQFYRLAAEVVVAFLGPRIEEIRIATKQPHLRLRRISDLRFIDIRTPDGTKIEKLTTAYHSWFENQERDRPHTALSQENWQTLTKASKRPTDSLEMPKRTAPLHESLLLDAELEADSDPRSATLYAALACELFINDWFERKSKTDSNSQYWLQWVQEHSKEDSSIAVGVRVRYDLGLRLVTGSSLKTNDGELWKRFVRLMNARNDVAHRGVLRNYEASEAVETSRDVMKWVQ